VVVAVHGACRTSNDPRNLHSTEIARGFCDQAGVPVPGRRPHPFARNRESCPPLHTPRAPVHHRLLISVELPYEIRRRTRWACNDVRLGSLGRSLSPFRSCEDALASAGLCYYDAMREFRLRANPMAFSCCRAPLSHSTPGSVTPPHSFEEFDVRAPADIRSCPMHRYLTLLTANLLRAASP